MRNRELSPFVILAIETGMRRSELVRLQWCNIDIKTRVAHLPDTTNGEPRDVPLSTRAVTTLRELALRTGSPSVFGSSRNALRLSWEHARKRAGLTDLRFHDLRHEAVSRLFEKVFNVIEVGTISGHTELRMLRRHTHLRAASLAEKLA
jgi:integrase